VSSVSSESNLQHEQVFSKHGWKINKTYLNIFIYYKIKINLIYFLPIICTKKRIFTKKDSKK